MSAPKELDDEALRAIARSFYAVRMVRYGLLAVALLVFLAVTLAQDSPTWVVSALAVSLVVLGGAVGATHRRYRRSLSSPPPGAASSPSPRG